MRQYAGKVLLITNVASECGFTDTNYKGLQKLYDKFQNRGFEVGAHRHVQVMAFLQYIAKEFCKRYAFSY